MLERQTKTSDQNIKLKFLLAHLRVQGFQLNQKNKIFAHRP